MLRAFLVFVLLPGALLPGPGSAAAAGPCMARSGPSARPLLELYGASVCQGCAQAEERLLELRGTGALVLFFTFRPPELERPASPATTPRTAARERRLTLAQRRALVVSPQVLLQGEAVHEWRTPALERALERAAAATAGAGLSLVLHGATAEGVDAEARLEEGPPEAEIFLAAFDWTAGRPPRAAHWEGPFRGRALRRRLPLPPDVRPVDAGVAAMVRGPGHPLLQALERGPCGIVPGSM